MTETQNSQAEEDPQTDHNHPLHLQASDVPGAALIPIKLTGPENYGIWSRSMRLALLVKNKLGFVDGTCVKSAYKGILVSKWERCDAVVLSWISAAVAPELMTSIVYAASSKRIWEDFKERFDKSNLTRIFYLWKEIGMLTQGTDSVTVYYSKMRDLWDELDVMVPNPSCDCVESRPHMEHVKQQRLLQFLVGLNESFAQVRSNILLSSSVPSVNQAYATAIQEESQRKLGVTEGGQEPMTMLAGRNSQFPPHQRFSGATGQQNHRPPNAHNHQNQSSFQTRRAGMVCEHCGYKGHMKDTCYRIVGFPADFKSKRKVHHEGSTPYANNSTMETGNSSGSSTSHGAFFTREQCDQLLSMLPPAPTGNCRTDAAGERLSPWMAVGCLTMGVSIIFF